MKRKEYMKSNSSPAWFCGSAREWGLMKEALGERESEDSRLKRLQLASASGFMGTFACGLLGTAVWMSAAIPAVALCGGALMALLYMPLGDVIRNIDAKNKGKISESRLSKIAEKIGVRRLGEMEMDLLKIHNNLFGKGIYDESSSANDLRYFVGDLKRAYLNHDGKDALIASIKSDLPRRMEEFAEVSGKKAAKSKEERIAELGGSSQELVEALSSFGEDGSDGLAAVALLCEERAGVFDAEKKVILTDRMPKLIAAYEQIPQEERDIGCETLDGETPRKKLTDSMTSILSSVLSLKRASAEAARVKLKAEASVCQESGQGAGLKF